jgi:hypothetical protein
MASRSYRVSVLHELSAGVEGLAEAIIGAVEGGSGAGWTPIHQNAIPAPVLPELQQEPEPAPMDLVRTNSVLATAKVEALLMEIDLEQYAAVFSQQGYSFVSDLLDADASKQQTCLSLRKCARMQAACRSDLSRVPVLAAR